jgi:hypothetical protein
VLQGQKWKEAYQHAVASMAARIACFHISMFKKRKKSDVNECKQSRAWILKDLHRTAYIYQDSALPRKLLCASYSEQA